MPTVRYNDSTGSNTLASGAGGTAVNGSAASATGATTTLSLGGTFDLSSFAAGDVIWSSSTAGERHLFTVASFTGGAATCTAVVVDQAVGATTFSGANWAMGGFRLSMQGDATREDWEDFDGWDAELNDDGDFTVSTLDPTDLGLVGGEAVWRTASGFTTRARLTSGAADFLSGTMVGGRGLAFEDLDISTDTGSGFYYGCNIQGGSSIYRFTRCSILSRWDAISMVGSDQIVDIEECDIRGVAQNGVIRVNGSGHLRIVRSHIHGTTTTGLALGFSLGKSSVVIQETMIHGCGGVGLAINGDNADVAVHASHLSIYGCTGYGVSITGTVARPQQIRLDNLIVEGCDDGVVCADSAAADCVRVESATYYDLQAGSPVEESNVTSIRKTTASASCFVDASGGDFTPSAQVDDEGRAIA